MIPVNPPAIIAAAEQRTVRQQQSQSITWRDKLHQQLFHGEIAHRARDGRTYNYQDRNGEWVSSFLSPYNSKILD